MIIVNVMRSMIAAVAAGAALMTVGWMLPPAVGAQNVASGQEGDQAVAVRNVEVQKNGNLTGEIVNQTRHSIRDARLLVRYVWLWKNERNPGTDNPGRAVILRLPGLVPPGGSAPFDYNPTPPLPERKDGRFITAVEISSFTEVE